MSEPVPASASGPGWTVRRRWMPRLGRQGLGQRFWARARRTFRRVGDNAGLPDGCGLDIGEGIVAAIVGLLVVAFVIFVVLPLLVAVVDLAILLLLAVVAIPIRVLFRRPWLVDAHHLDGRGYRWRVVGWRASGDKVVEVRQLLEAGVVPPDAEELPPSEAVAP